MSIQTIIALCIFVLMALALAVWISSGRYGKLRPSQEATDAYTSFQVDPEKYYYSSGPYFYPNALMGIDKAWTEESGLWKKRELTNADIRELVVNMQSKAMEQMASLHGFDVIDDKGGKIGDWYSIPGMNITIKVTGEKRVAVSTPPIEINP
jgi:hypothetical protein